jgi:HPt (histidine-containing phosphotransfer) domain-containing protein
MLAGTGRKGALSGGKVMDGDGGRTYAGDSRAVAASGDRPVDLVHLARQSLGDPALEAEILMLFRRQAPQLADRMRRTEAAGPVADLAHTLKGSALGIGAFALARAAAALEAACRTGDSAAALLAWRRMTAELAAVEAFLAGLERKAA